MKYTLTTVFVAILLCCSTAQAATDSLALQKEYYQNAKQELENMLDGKQALSFERAIFLIENAYSENSLDYEGYKHVIDLHALNVVALSQANDLPDSSYHPTPLQSLMQSENSRSHSMDNLRKNWAIYTYIVDTTVLYRNIDGWRPVKSLPFKYSYSDPMGTRDWQNTLVSHMLLTRTGNCFALAAFYKILSERLGTDAALSTAPSHIYITHRNEQGIPFNIELSNGRFAGTGTLATLTYTTNDAIRNNIALRELDLKQSIALCLVYLAKGYEYKFGNLQDNFVRSCADAAMKHDALSLNAMLLKAEVLEAESVTKNSDVKTLQQDNVFVEYQSLITRLYKLGYREMPLEMKNVLIKGWTKDTLTHLFLKSNLPEAYNHSGVKNTRYASLSWGMFDEEIKYKPIEKFGRAVYDVKKQKIIRFENSDRLYNDYNFDPVVFAWNIDPLAHEYPGLSPYSAFAGNPIIFKDKGGAYVEGMDGKPVTYKMLTGGKISWSANASAETKRIGNAMIKTETGRQQFAKMQETAHPIGVHLNRPNDGDFGKTIVKWGQNTEGQDVVERADIYVNVNSMKMWKGGMDNQAKGISDIKGVLKDYIKSSPDGEDKQGYQYYLLMTSGKMEDAIGATGSHEAEHATNPENLAGEKANRNGGKVDIESVPNQIEQKDLNERTNTQ